MQLEVRISAVVPVFVMSCLLVNGCANVGGSVHAAFDSIQPGMTVPEVTAVIGSPDDLVGEVTTAYGQHVLVWEYQKITERIVLPSDSEVFWIYVVDGKFLKYSGRGDWKKEAGVIYNTDFSKEQLN